MDLSQATPRTRAALTRQEQQVIKHSKAGVERSINRQDILTEDEYIEGLEKIIARDFFPLVSERLQQREQEQEILAGFNSQDPDIIERSVTRMEHLANNDPAWSERISRRRNVGDTPRFDSVTPAGRSIYGETPVASTSSHQSRLPQARYDATLSLDDYQAKYTSEDNASFAQIMDDENVKRRSRYSWAYQAEKKATDKSRRAIEARQQLVDLSRRLTEGDREIRLIEGSEPGRPGQRLLIEGRTSLPGDSASLDYAKRRVIAAAPTQERLMIEGSSGQVSEPKALTVQERETQLAKALREKKDEIDQTRQESEVGTGVTAWPFTARNNFYFAPDANVPIQDTGKKTTLEKAKEEAIDNLGTTASKGIRYGATRIFDDAGLDEEARKAGVPPSPSHSNIAAAISGTPYPGRSSMTPRVQGYSFVDAMPSPSPSEMGSQGVNALMTFGTLASTPVAIRDPNRDDPVFKAPAPPRDFDEFEGGPFRINKTPRREMLAHKMASKASRSLSKRQHESGNLGGLGLLRMGDRTLGATPGASSVRSTTSTGQADATPGRDSFLSPAAKTLLGRARGPSRDSDLSPAIKKRGQEDRDRESLDRLKRQKWDPSPLRSGTTQSSLSR